MGPFGGKPQEKRLWNYSARTGVRVPLVAAKRPELQAVR